MLGSHNVVHRLINFFYGCFFMVHIITKFTLFPWTSEPWFTFYCIATFLINKIKRKDLWGFIIIEIFSPFLLMHRISRKNPKCLLQFWSFKSSLREVSWTFKWMFVNLLTYENSWTFIIIHNHSFSFVIVHESSRMNANERS